MVKVIIGLLFSIAITYFLTPYIVKLAHKLGAIDTPKDDRRVHSTPIPRLGGIGIFVSFMVIMFVFSDIETHKKLGIFLGATVIVLMGIVDDINPLSAKVKLFVQLIASVIVVFFGVSVDILTDFIGISTGGYLSLDVLKIPITVVWILLVTNTLNLIDGLDGLAVGVTIIATIFLAYVSYVMGNTNIAILTLILMGSGLGFLPYNFNPAKIFMGDTGSYFLGFMLAVISIEGTLKGVTMFSVIIPLLIIGVPIFDTVFAVVRRFIARKPIFGADKGHIHHRLMYKGYSHKVTVLILYGVNILSGLGAVYYMSM